MLLSDTDSNEYDGCIEKQTETCAECKGILRHDRQHGHAYCEDCGLVVEQADCHLWRENDGGHGGTNDDSSGAGTGALSVKKDGNSRINRRIENSERRTTFHSFDSDDHDKFRELWKHHHGWMGNNVEQRKNHDFRQKTVEAIADTLHVGDALTEKAKRLATQCEPQPFNPIGGPYAIALGCIAVAQNDTIETIEEYKNRIQVREYDRHDGDEPKFKVLAEKHSVDWRKAITKVKEQQNSGR